MPKNLVFRIIISVYVGFAVFRLTDPTLIWHVQNGTPSANTVRIYPAEIKIPKINLDLSISPAVVVGNSWELFDDRIAWLSSSAPLGKGNTILYGHDRKGLFGDLYKLRKGDEIQVSQDGKWYNFVVSETRAVRPTDINSILSPNNQITIYTCEGTFDQKRLVVYAE